MGTKIFRDFHFEAAHCLPNVPEGHICGGMHGHSYKVRFELTGHVDRVGWVMDWDLLIDVWEKEIRPHVDHKTLNDAPGLSNPTCELLAKWIYWRVRDKVPLISKVIVNENPFCGAEYSEP